MDFQRQGVLRDLQLRTDPVIGSLQLLLPGQDRFQRLLFGQNLLALSGFALGLLNG